MTANYQSEGTHSPDGLVAGLPSSLLSRKVTVLSGQDLSRGALVGKVTASGKYVLSLSASADGSETPDGILAEDCDASGGDAEALVYFRGDFSEAAVTFGTAHTAASVREGLRGKNIELIKAEV